MKNIQVTKPVELLDEKGNLSQPGYAVKSDIYVYDRSKIKANPMRIKEWDFYQINTDRYVVQINIFDISLAGAVTFSIRDLETDKKEESVTVDLLTNGSFKLPESAEKPHSIAYDNHGAILNIEVADGKRHIYFKKGYYEADVTMQMLRDHESLVMAVPFKEKGHFYYNQKMNCMTVSGFAKSKNIRAEFTPDKAFCVLDWGRGVWPYKVDWYWGNGTTILDNGKLFGFEIGWGFGDMSAASENMLFYNGKGHKIGNISLFRNESNIMDPWVFKSDDGRFNMTMVPVSDNYSSTRVAGVIGNRCHQVFGKWSGTAVLDNGRVIEIKDVTAFCEHSDNRW